MDGLEGTRLSLGRGWSLESRGHASGRLDDVPADAIVRVVHPDPAPLSEDGMGVLVGPTTLPSKSTSPATGVRLAGSWAVTITGMPDAHSLRRDLELAGHLCLMHAGGEQLNSRLARPQPDT